jgi:hypothetical protein
MAAYLEEHRNMEKRFQGLELRHIPHGENAEGDEIAKRASHHLVQLAGVLEERLFKPSASPPSLGPEPPLALPPPPEQGLQIVDRHQAIAFFWYWQGMREWTGSLSSRHSSSVASYQRRSRKLKGSLVKLRGTASKTAICTRVAPTAWH